MAHAALNVNQNDKHNATANVPTTKATTKDGPNKYAKTLSSVGYAKNHHDPTTLGKQTT
jgi:hypothetical protein